MNDKEYRQDNAGWYAPLARETKACGEKKKGGIPTVWRVLLGALLVLGLIAGSSFFFAQKAVQTAANGSAARRDEKTSPGIDDSFTFMIPGLPDKRSDAGTDEAMPDDWKDYFSSYYVMENNGKTVSDIPVAEERPAWRLELEDAEGEALSLQELYRDCVDSIVSIKSYTGRRDGYFWGTGIVLSADGLILTNAHVIEDCKSATVMLQNNQEYEAKLVGLDGTSDIAVLLIEAEDLTPAVFGDSEALDVGESVAAIGNPLGEEFRATLTNGIISAIDRGVSYEGHSMNLIQTNTAINEGNSGGALLNMYGQVIGVTNMKMMSSFSSIEGIGFAIPSATIRTIVNALVLDGAVKGRPALGITVGSVPQDAAEYYELPDGLYVSKVSEGSDAEKKGLREGDIITAVNGKPAENSNVVIEVRDALSIGDTITFTIWRAGESFDVEVALIEFNDVY